MQLPVPARPDLATVDVERAPFLVIWEATRACALACRHCRASAQRERDRRELGTTEVRRVMDQVRAFGNPLFIITGGDPLERPDIVSLVEYGARLGLRVAMTPSGTPRMTPEILASLQAAGLARLAVSIDGSCPDVHDGFRRVAGSWAWSVAMLRAARDLGLPIQVNTTVGPHNVDDWEGLVPLLEELGIALWSVFFVVPTGRARPGDLLEPGRVERVLERLYELSLVVPFDIKTTAAPQYRRVALQRQVATRRVPDAWRPGVPLAPARPLVPAIGSSLAGPIPRAQGITDGRGMLFISHTGEIFPSGFLPVSAGNVRSDSLASVYRDGPLFVALRDTDRLKGKCGVCLYRRICGGSRARAWAITGDWHQSDPSCSYLPPAWRRRGEASP